MQKALSHKTNKLYYFKNNEKKIIDPNDPATYPVGVRGDLSDITGDLSDIRGNLSGIIGDLSGIRGNLSGIIGDLSGIIGDLTDCQLTEEDRKKGIKIEDLVK